MLMILRTILVVILGLSMGFTKLSAQDQGDSLYRHLGVWAITGMWEPGVRKLFCITRYHDYGSLVDIESIAVPDSSTPPCKGKDGKLQPLFFMLPECPEGKFPVGPYPWVLVWCGPNQYRSAVRDEKIA